MKSLAPSLAALAVIGMVPAFGANIADDLTIKPKAVIQARMQLGASGQDYLGNEYNIYNGAAGVNEAARFSVRRARFGAEASNTTGWKGVLQFRGAERADASSTATTRTVEVYYANVSKTFKVDSMEHEIGFGLDKPFNNESSISSSTYLFPSDRALAHAMEVRNVGIGYKFTGMDLVRAGFNVQNGGGARFNEQIDNNTSATGSQVNGDTNGLFYSARIEFSPTAELFIKKKAESFAGTEGTGLLIGFDYQNANRQFTNNITASGNTLPAPATYGSQTTTTTWGPDILLHMDGLSLLAEYRKRFTSNDRVGNSTTPQYDFPSTMWDVVLGYAIPMDAGFVIEPAFRFVSVNLDTNKDAGDRTADPTFGFTTADNSTNPYNEGEYRATQSGKEFGFGVNFYWNGHANKTQLAYTSFIGDDAGSTGPTTQAGAGSAKAHVFTIQQQITF